MTTPSNGKNKGGRPPRPASERQSQPVMVRFTEDERAEVARRATAAGMTTAGWVRDIIIKRLRRV